LKDRYFKHRQEILISRERANLPGLQQAAHTEKGRRDRSNAINVLIAEIKELTEVRNTIRLEYIRLSLNKNEEELRKVSVDMDQYLAIITTKKEQLYELRVYGPNQIRAAGAAMAAADAAGAAVADAPAAEEKDERKKFIRRCMRRNCNGFLSTAWKCGLCEWYSCSKCFTERGPDHDSPHECKKEDVETAELIRSDSKPCPNCGEFINKSSGCFAPNTPILLYNGTIAMSQDIRVGDELVGDDGEKRTVLGLVDGEDMMYEVKQNNGMKYTVNGKHTLVLQLRTGCDYERMIEKLKVFPQPDDFPNTVYVVVEDYIHLSESIKDALVGYKNTGETSDISVTPVGQGNYFGWSIDCNKRFLLADTTVLRNCDQMYCISCQTPFSWTTLKIVTSGVIHNPHYYEMMRRKGGAPPRNPGDVPCGGFPAVWQLIDHPRGVRAYVTEYYREFHRLCQEVQDVSLRSYRTHVDNTLSTGINIQFLLNDFSEVKWGQKLAMNEKKRKRDAEIQEVFAAFLMVAVNIINTIQNYVCPVRGLTFPQLPVEDAEKILIELHGEITELIAIMNDAFKGISMSYSYTVPYIETRMAGIPHLAMYRLQVMNFKTKSKVQNMEDDEDE